MLVITGKREDVMWKELAISEVEEIIFDFYYVANTITSEKIIFFKDKVQQGKNVKLYYRSKKLRRTIGFNINN